MGMARIGFLGCSALLSVIAISFVILSDLMPNTHGGYADQRFLQVLLTGILAAGSILSIVFLPKPSQTLSIRRLLPFFVLALSFPLLSVPYSGQPYVWVEPGLYFFYFFSIACSGWTLASFDQEHCYTTFLTSLVAVACCLYGAMSINVYLFALFDGVTDLVDFLPWGFVNIRYWSQVATWFLPILPLAVLIGPFKGHRLWRTLVALGGGLWWWLIFLSVARGSLVSLLFGATLVFALFGHRVLIWLKLFLGYAVIGIVLWLVLSVLIPSFLAEGAEIRSVSSDSAGRVPLFVEACAMSLQNFPFGMGPQSWLTHEAITESYKAGNKFGHPHNMYLMWAAEYGWLLFVFVLVVVMQSVILFWRRRNVLLASRDSKELLLLAGFTASVSSALFHAGISAVFMAPGSMLVGLFVLLGFWSLIQAREQTITLKAQRKSVRIRSTIALIAALCVAVFWALWARNVIVYYHDMRADEVFYGEAIVEGIYPRFWFHGNFPRHDSQMEPR